MAFKTSQIALNDATPTALWQFGGTAPPQVLNPSAGSLQDSIPMILVCTAAAIYLGGSNVSASNGFLLPAGVPLPISFFGSSEILYAISSTGTPTVDLLFGRQ